MVKRSWWCVSKARQKIRQGGTLYLILSGNKSSAGRQHVRVMDIEGERDCQSAILLM
jgi:hypothetical protein